MKSELKQISLESLGRGAALELFSEEMRKVLENIADPNTPWKEPRIISMRVKITPSTEERSGASVEISAVSRLAPYKPFGTYVLVGLEAGQVIAYENNPKQPELAGLGESIKQEGMKR